MPISYPINSNKNNTMISGSHSSSYPNGGFHMYDALEEMLSSPTTGMATEAAVEGMGLLFHNMSVLRDKVDELDSIVDVVMSTDQIRIKESSFSPAVAVAGTLLQDVILAASSLMFAFQQLGSSGDDHEHVNVVGDYNQLPQQQPGGCGGGLMATKIVRHSIGDNSVIDTLTTNNNNRTNYGKVEPHQEKTNDVTTQFHHNSSPSTATGTAAIDVIELEVADLLAKYTHYCQICGKGFKRDTNLRMHMRAHGDEYKTNKALINPMKFINKDQEQQQQQTSGLTSRKYSCPQEGCRWNKNHAKFQPLKSMVCVKNHYKRSHCPKMYVCNRCNRKHFSVLSDLRTHEKHCGDLRWQCSCGTSFSRKDKLMGHVALFVGHSPVAVPDPVTLKGA